MRMKISPEPQHSVCFGSRIGRSLLSLLAGSPLSLGHPAVPARLHGQLDRGVTRLRFCWVTFFWPILLSRQSSFLTLPALWFLKELKLQEARILREAGILSLAFSFRTRLNQKKPPSVKATDRQDPSAAPDYLLFSKTCFLRKLLLK